MLHLTLKLSKGTQLLTCLLFKSACCTVSIFGGRIIDNLQINNRCIDNLTNFRQIDNLTFSKIDSAIPLPCPHGLGNWHHGVLLSLSWVGEVGLSNFFALASWVRKLAS